MFKTMRKRKNRNKSKNQIFTSKEKWKRKHSRECAFNINTTALKEKFT